MRAVGSVTIKDKKHPMRKKRKLHFAAEIGGVTDMALTVSGLVEQSWSKSLSGWMRQTETNLGGFTHKRILSAGRRR
jgi:hypothetical protein